MNEFIAHPIYDSFIETTRYYECIGTIGIPFWVLEDRVEDNIGGVVDRIREINNALYKEHPEIFEGIMHDGEDE